MKIDKNEQYVVFTPDTLDTDTLKDFEKQVVQHYKEGIVNYVIDCSNLPSFSEEGTALLGKINKLCQRESGILLVAAANADILDSIDHLQEEDVVFLPTLHEAVEAVFMHELENEFKDEADEEDMFGFGEEEGQ